MTVKQFWQRHLGEFRQEERQVIQSLKDKHVAVDVSAWVHQFDGIHDVQFARTSNPPYPHPAIVNSFSSRYATLKKLGIHPIFVFDGQSPKLKKRTNRKRQKKSALARIAYQSKLEEIKQRNTITDEERKELLKLRRDTSRPIPEDYATLAQWMDDNDIEYVQAPFEADAQIKQLISEQRATAAITEDGDLVVFGVPHILSQVKFDHKSPEKCTCQYFDVDKLKAGEYKSPIAIGNRCDYLAEISCLSGNDYINNVPNVGPAAIFGTHRGRTNQTALIDSFINETATNQSTTVEEWLDTYVTKYGKKSSTEDEDWTANRFIKVRNLVKHYPVFSMDKETGDVTLQPLNPLPSNVSNEEWGNYIGFDKHPSEYFDINNSNNYKQYYNMTIVSSNNRPRDELLGPVYTANENPKALGSILPLFAKLDFETEPISVQPMSVLRSHLLARGLTIPSNVSDEIVRDTVRNAHGVKKRVLDPELVPEPDSWTGFEPLLTVERGDKYDDWVRRTNTLALYFLMYIISSYYTSSFNTE